MFSEPVVFLQVFVSAAHMEYFISKDKSIAYKIFELGMKKFSDEPKYVLAYLDYLSHMNGKGSSLEKALL